MITTSPAPVGKHKSLKAATWLMAKSHLHGFLMAMALIIPFIAVRNNLSMGLLNPSLPAQGENGYYFTDEFLDAQRDNPYGRLVLLGSDLPATLLFEVAMVMNITSLWDTKDHRATWKVPLIIIGLLFDLALALIATESALSVSQIFFSVGSIFFYNLGPLMTAIWKLKARLSMTTKEFMHVATCIIVSVGLIVILYGAAFISYTFSVASSWADLPFGWKIGIRAVGQPVLLGFLAFLLKTVFTRMPFILNHGRRMMVALPVICTFQITGRIMLVSLPSRNLRVLAIAVALGEVTTRLVTILWISRFKLKVPQKYSQLEAFHDPSHIMAPLAVVEIPLSEAALSAKSFDEDIPSKSISSTDQCSLALEIMMPLVWVEALFEVAVIIFTECAKYVASNGVAWNPTMAWDLVKVLLLQLTLEAAVDVIVWRMGDKILPVSLTAALLKTRKKPNTLNYFVPFAVGIYSTLTLLTRFMCYTRALGAVSFEFC